MFPKCSARGSAWGHDQQGEAERLRVEEILCTVNGSMDGAFLICASAIVFSL